MKRQGSKPCIKDATFCGEKGGHKKFKNSCLPSWRQGKTQEPWDKLALPTPPPWNEEQMR